MLVIFVWFSCADLLLSYARASSFVGSCSPKKSRGVSAPNQVRSCVFGGRFWGMRIPFFTSMQFGGLVFASAMVIVMASPWWPMLPAGFR